MFLVVCAGLIPIPSLVIIALVSVETLNSAATNLKTAEKGLLWGLCAEAIVPSAWS